jgi:hypothetical protein
LTDNEQLVLENLRTCVHLNAAADEAAAANGGSTSSSSKPVPAASDPGQPQSTSGQPRSNFYGVTDEELFDDAESVEEFDFSGMAAVNGGGGSGSGAGGEAADALKAATANEAWEAGNMEVRFLDWQSSLEALDGPGATAAAGLVGGVTNRLEDALAITASAADDAGSSPAAAAAVSTAAAAAITAGPPAVPESEVFPTILANETMYEPEHAVLVAAVLAHRLAPAGRALLCSAVRFTEVFATFARACAARGLRHRVLRVAPETGDFEGGILRDDYDGGYVMIAVDWAAAPGEWHRDDFA